MKNSLDLINKENTSLNEEMEKVLKGNAAAGRRARKHLMDIISTCKSLRKEIQEAKNSK